jgi:alkylhydroperoxidase family enzyme
MVRVPYLEMQSLGPGPEDPTPYNPDWVSDHNIHRAMANHPEALRVFWPRIGMWLRGKSSLEPRLRELAIIQTSYTTASGYEFAHHVHFAKSVGVTEEDVLALIDESKGKQSHLNELDSAAIRLARTLTTDIDVDDTTWNFLHDRLGTECLLELVLAVSYYNHIIRLVTALQVGIQSEEGEEDLKPYLDKFDAPEEIGRWR